MSSTSSKKSKLLHGDEDQQRPKEEREQPPHDQEDQHVNYHCEDHHRSHPHDDSYYHTRDDCRSSAADVAKTLRLKVLYIEPNQAICQGCMNVGFRGFICSTCNNQNYFDTVRDPIKRGEVHRDIQAVHDNLFHRFKEIYATYLNNIGQPLVERDRETFVEEPDSIFRRLVNVPNYYNSQWRNQVVPMQHISNSYPTKQQLQLTTTPQVHVEPTTSQTSPTDQNKKCIFREGVPLRSVRKRKYPRKSQQQEKQESGDSTRSSPTSTDSSWSP